MSRARFTACHLPWTADSDCACLSPGERTQKDEKTRQEMSRNQPQRRKARARNGVALKKTGSLIAGLVRAAHPLTDAASVILTSRQRDGNPCPAEAGQRQRSWLSAKHDSPGSRQGSRLWPYYPGRKPGRTVIFTHT